MTEPKSVSKKITIFVKNPDSQFRFEEFIKDLLECCHKWGVCRGAEKKIFVTDIEIL